MVDLNCQQDSRWLVGASKLFIGWPWFFW